MPRKPNREDNTEWKASSPKDVKGQTWRQWALSNPNREGDARRTEARMKDAVKKGKAKEESTKQLTSKGAPAKPREKKVANWKAQQPVFGKGGAKTPEEKEAKRQSMIDWAKSNPNRMDNARRAQGKAPSQQKGGQGKRKP